MPIIAAVLALSLQAPAPHVGLSEFHASSDLQPLAGALSGLVANELQRMGAFEVTTPAQVREMLSLDRQQQMLGCDDDTCRSGILNNLGFDYLVTGALTGIKSAPGKPGLFSLELVLIDRKTHSRAGSEVLSAGSEAELVQGVPNAVAKLVSKLLSEHSGALVVRSSEVGSVVKVDEVVVGTTPLEGRLKISAGQHLVRVEKDGFVAWQKQVQIVPEQLSEESPHLVPSPDFITAYESKQRKLRAGAWAATALAVAGVGAGIAFEVRSNQLYGSRDQAGSFLALREKVASGDETARNQMNAVGADVSTSQTLTGVFIGVGAAAGVAAAALWVLGDDPGKYGAYREVGLTAGLAPTNGGGFAVLSGVW